MPSTDQFSGLGMLAGIDLCLLPAAASPDGRPPNFVNPQSLQPAVITVSTLMLTLATLILAGRIFVNRKSMKSSDWLMIVGFAFDIAIMAVQLALSDRFRHMWDTPVCRLMGNYIKLIFVIDIMTGPALFFPKAAIFLFYIQIFHTTRSVRIGSILGIFMAFLAYFPASLVLSYYNAPHVGQSWDVLYTNGMPEKGIPGGVTIGVASVIVDIYIFFLPLPTLMGLNMSPRKRIQLISLFATAFFGVAASVICMAYRIKLVGHIHDLTWQVGVVALPIIVENNVAIIVGSLPAFAGFLRKYIAESSAYKVLCTFWVSSKAESKRSWKQNTPIVTIGSGGKNRKKESYYELSEASTLKSTITMPEGIYIGRDLGRPEIVRTVEFSQQEHRSESIDRLV